MKKLCCLCLCVFLLFSFAPSRAAGVTPVMRVVKCSEWVSLRALPSTTSERLAKVYLGELVTECSASSDGFIYCNYNGKTGYILYEYLAMTDFPAYAVVYPNLMVVNCTDWVSLRSGPYESAPRLKTVPLGAIVVACVQDTGQYISCEYQGVRGYILETYLKKANYAASSMDTKVVTKAEGKYPPINGPMTVVNCAEWVSLREKASAGSARLARVPLGDKVDNCVQVDDRFIYCSYKNLWGYIDIQYLQGENAAGNPFDRLSGSPTRAEFDQVGFNALEFTTDDGITVAVRYAMSGGAEYMCAMFFDAYGNNQGRLDAVNPEATELTGLQAFKGGTESDPRLIWLTRQSLSSYAVDKVTGGMSMRWTLDLRNTWWSVGSSACFAADTDGTLYLCGYYNASPVCISHDGVPLWRAQNDDPDIFWPSSIQITSYGIDVTYDGGAEGENGTVLSFDRSGNPAEKSGWRQYLDLRESWDPEEESVDYTYATEAEGDSTLIVITCVSPGGLSGFTILSTEGSQIDPSGNLHAQTHDMMTLARLDTDETVGALLVFDGIIPMNGISFYDGSGTYHRYLLDFSGEDGSLMLMEF